MSLYFLWPHVLPTFLFKYFIIKNCLKEFISFRKYGLVLIGGGIGLVLGFISGLSSMTEKLLDTRV